MRSKTKNEKLNTFLVRKRIPSNLPLTFNSPLVITPANQRRTPHPVLATALSAATVNALIEIYRMDTLGKTKIHYTGSPKAYP